MTLDEAMKHSFFKVKGTGELWFMESYQIVPSATLINLESGERMTVELNGRADQYVAVKLPNEVETEMRKVGWMLAEKVKGGGK